MTKLHHVFKNDKIAIQITKTRGPTFYF